MNPAARIIAGFGIAAVLAFGAYLAMPQRPASEARIVTLAGEELSVAGLRGKVAVVNFWATWCGACIKEMPRLVQSHRRYSGRGLETVAIAVRDRPEQVAAFARERALPFRVALDTDGQVSRRFGNIRVTPTTYVFGRDGRLLKRYVGEPDWTEFDRLLERALAAPGEIGL